ncbi:hypothetical protein Pfo_018310 [Paulownia fortunei]|nr:hypothetical protein Pfo_018310 [Paulownia fortunei]
MGGGWTDDSVNATEAFVCAVLERSWMGVGWTDDSVHATETLGCAVPKAAASLLRKVRTIVPYTKVFSEGIKWLELIFFKEESEVGVSCRLKGNKTPLSLYVFIYLDSRNLSELSIVLREQDCRFVRTNSWRQFQLWFNSGDYMDAHYAGAHYLVYTRIGETVLVGHMCLLDYCDEYYFFCYIFRSIPFIRRDNNLSFADEVLVKFYDIDETLEVGDTARTLIFCYVFVMTSKLDFRVNYNGGWEGILYKSSNALNLSILYYVRLFIYLLHFYFVHDVVLVVGLTWVMFVLFLFYIWVTSILLRLIMVGISMNFMFYLWRNILDMSFVFFVVRLSLCKFILFLEK